MKIYSLLFALLLMCCNVVAQQASADSIKTETGATEKKWSFSASAFYYLLPGESDIFSPIAYLDRGKLHFEGRYNYEDHKTGSLFAGWKFSGGNKFEYSFTPMVGLIVGNTDGIAPGLEIELAWKMLDFYSESEYVFDFASKENNFAYTWSEIGITPFENFRTGITVQRTRLYQTNLDTQRGIMASYTFKNATVGTHYFNPFSESWFLVFVLSYEF
jgi:hypothetical protein